MSDQTVVVRVVSQEQYDEGPFDFGASYEDGSLDRVIESLAAIRESIPEQYRATACCEISSVGGYEGEHHANIEVTYSRPETPDEAAAREAKSAGDAARREAEERAAYLALRQKYGEAAP